MSDKPIQPQDKYVLRMPDGMRDRIKKAADRSGRSMNAEIVTALEHYYPAEPSIEDVLEKVHSAISQANAANSLPYRGVLIDALDELSSKLASGLEFSQHHTMLPQKATEDWGNVSSRLVRWRRAQKHGVETKDLERELERGLLQHFGGNVINAAISLIKDGKPERAMGIFRLGDVKFADPPAAYAAIDRWLRAFYSENWGDPDEPWQLSDEF